MNTYIWYNNKYFLRDLRVKWKYLNTVFKFITYEKHLFVTITLKTWWEHHKYHKEYKSYKKIILIVHEQNI